MGARVRHGTNQRQRTWFRMGCGSRISDVVAVAKPFHRTSGVIEELARHLDIKSRYTDFYGNANNVLRSSLLALVHAMGYPVRDDADAGAALHHLREMQKGLESVYVTPAESPAIDAVCRQSWSLEREGSVVRSGLASGSIDFRGGLAPAYYDLT